MDAAPDRVAEPPTSAIHRLRTLAKREARHALGFESSRKFNISAGILMLLLWNVWKDFFPPDRIGGSYLANLLLGVAIVLLLGYLVTFPERLVRRWRADRFADSPNSASVGQVVDDIES